MKKNAMMKIAAILMVAVLLTTCAISSTFAKYTTSGSAKDDARVAKWGVDLTVGGDAAMFAKVYGDNLVVSEENVIAPGTKNTNALSLDVEGEPEVMTKLTVTDKEGKNNYIVLSNWEQGYKNAEGEDATTYCPLVFTVDGTDIKIGSTYTKGDQPATVTNATTLAEAVNLAIAAAVSDKTYEVGTKIAADFKLGWAWNFESTGADADAVNENDTALGNLFEDSTSKKAPTIEINFNITVEQVSTNVDIAPAVQG